MGNERRVYVVGGGLAGMTVAHELAKAGVPVTLLEVKNRLGGKAGADEHAALGTHLDHGFHIFPLWYTNVRALLEELGLLCRLKEADRQHTITRPEAPGRPGKWFTNYAVTSPKVAWDNLRDSPLLRGDALLGSYFLIDLALAKLNDVYLDRVSVTGMFRSRYYSNEAVANFQHFLGLQASSIPADELSAKTFQKVVRGFMAHPKKLVAILPGDLENELIKPFRERLLKKGVRIQMNLRVEKPLQFHGGRVANLLVTPVEPDTGVAQGVAPRPLGELIEEQPTADDFFVLATPPEVTVGFVDDTLYGLERDGDDDVKQLAGLHHLVSEPMAALHVVFKKELEHIPLWHTGLHDSRYSLSFIDISKHWPELGKREQTVLSVIAANFAELQSLSEKEQKEHILKDLLEFLRYDAKGKQQIYDVDVEAVQLNSNVCAPLFLNTTSAWHFRPDGRTRIGNLFVAGDYCRSFADLTTMESAVSSGLSTAGHILEKLGRGGSARAPKEFKPPSCWKLRGIKAGLYLPVAGVALWRWLQGRAAALSKRPPPASAR